MFPFSFIIVELRNDAQKEIVDIAVLGVFKNVIAVTF
jgi:glycerol-3-phosphate dehydrogenase